MASCIAFSVLESRADVASSNIIILGCFNKALAIATLCFSPPDSFKPLSPTTVWIPKGKDEINASKLAS